MHRPRHPYLSDTIDGRQRGCYAATMGLLDRMAAALAWLGRQGTTAVAVSILLGIVLPPLGALVRPFFPETVFVLLCLAFLRVDPGALRAQLARPRLLIAAAAWIMLVVPVLAGLAFNAIDLRDQSPALLLALVLNMVAPPIFASPALAALMGLNAAITLALLLVCIAVTPFLAPALVAVFAGSGGDLFAARARPAPRADAGGRRLRRDRHPRVHGQAMGRAAGRAHRRAQRHRAVPVCAGADGRRADQHHRPPACSCSGCWRSATAVTFGLCALTALLLFRAGLPDRAAARARGGAPATPG